MNNQYGINYPLHSAAISGNLSLVEDMITEVGLNAKYMVNHIDPEGRTPFHYAIINNHFEIIAILLLGGADVSIPINDAKGFTPLYLATLGEQQYTIELLLDAGADPNQKSKVGFAPLHEAARIGNFGVTELLFSKGADPNIKGPDDSTPICWAITNGHPEVLELLLENGANPNIRGIRLESYLDDPTFRAAPIYIAAMNNDFTSVEILIRYKADPCSPTAFGPGRHTALHEAARNGNINLVNLLLTTKIDKNHKAMDGTTARDWAVMMGHHDVEKVLSKRNWF